MKKRIKIGNLMLMVIDHTPTSKEVQVVSGYERWSDGCEIHRDLEFRIELNHYGKRPVSDAEVELAVEVATDYANRILEMQKAD